jgi:peptide/nickel transport system substrate-binding protein
MNVRAVGRTTVAIAVIVIVIIAAVGIYFVSQTTTTSMTTSSTMGPATTASGAPQTLTIDDAFWPSGDLNRLTALGEIPYPDWLAYTVYQPLVTLNASLLYQSGDIQMLPVLATNWTVSPDGMTYTFSLRQNVTFSNGDPFNSYQVWGEMYGFYYLSGNSSSFLNAYNVFDMSNVTFGPATLALMAQSGLINPSSNLMTIMSNSNWPIYVTGPNQIVFHLKSAFHWLPQILVAYVALIFDTQYVLQNGGFGTPTAYNTLFNQHPMPGTGPYVVTDVSEGSYVKFTQNPNYWGVNLSPADIQGNPYLDPGHVKNVIINAKADDVARYTDLSTGQAQIAAIQQQNWPLVLANPDKYGYIVMPDASMVFVGIAMNTHRFPTNNTDFRLAIQHAINITDISKRAFFGQLGPMVGPEYPAQKDWYDLGNLPPYSYNLTLAQWYLSQSGINVATMQPIQFNVVSGCTYCNSAAQIVQADLAQIGITVNIQVLPGSEYALPNIAGASSYSAALADANQIGQLSWFGTGTFAPGAATPADAWILFANQNTPANNWAIYANPVVQKCVDSWTSTGDLTTIRNLCTQAQAQIYNDAPYIWLGTVKLVFGGGSVAYDKNVIQNLYLDPLFTAMSSTVIFNTVTFVSS